MVLKSISYGCNGAISPGKDGRENGRQNPNQRGEGDDKLQEAEANPQKERSEVK
jgi:hypothetical protein